MTQKLNKRLLMMLMTTCFLVVIIGTLTHELGHFAAAKAMGFEAHISYKFTSLKNDGAPVTSEQWFWFTLAGPLQTMLTGTTALFILLADKPAKDQLSLKQWLLVFLSLFWMRQPVNFFLCMLTYMRKGTFPTNGDEVKISRYLGWPLWSVTALTAFAGLMVLYFLLFYLLPKSLRLTFIVAGILGGIAGFLFWLVYAGKFILP